MHVRNVTLTYTNDLLKKLDRFGFGVHVGCDGREVGVPALAFADDIALVAPTPNTLHLLLWMSGVGTMGLPLI